MKSYFVAPILCLCFALPTQAQEVEVDSLQQFTSTVASSQNKPSKREIKRDRDSETCSDRGCGRYLKERGSGRVSKKPN